jgi:hypothetical protein
MIKKLTIAVTLLATAVPALAFEPPATYDKHYKDDYALYVESEGANHLTNYTELKNMSVAAELCHAVGVSSKNQWPGFYWDELSNVAATHFEEIRYDPMLARIYLEIATLQNAALEKDPLNYILDVCPSVQEPEFVQ